METQGIVYLNELRAKEKEISRWKSKASEYAETLKNLRFRDDSDDPQAYVTNKIIDRALTTE